MNKLDGMSMDIEKNEREKLKSIFPQCFVEDKLDIDKLLNMCGGEGGGNILQMILKNTILSGKVKASACR